MEAFYKMALNGRVFLFRNGENEMSPIHGTDLAKVCVAAMDIAEKEVPVGAPGVLTYNQIAEAAFDEIGKKKRITHLPIFVARSALFGF